VPLQRLYMRVLSADIAGCWSGQDKLEPSSTELSGTAAIVYIQLQLLKYTILHCTLSHASF
jgi:uncharacterized protein YraI